MTDRYAKAVLTVSAAALVFIAPAAAQTIVEKGDWLEAGRLSRLTDRLNVYAALESADRPLGTLDRPIIPKMLLQCHENATAVTFHFDIYIGSDEGPLSYRLDRGAPVTEQASVSTEGVHIGYWRGEAIQFLNRIASAKRILVRIKPYREGEREAEFDLTGIKRQIERVRSACNW